LSLPSISAQDALGVVAISGAARTGLDQLKQVLWKAVEQARLEEPEVMEPGEVAVDEEEELEW
jgi:hypothetical protein